MNLIISLLVIIGVMLLVKPVQAVNRGIADRVIPSMVQSSFKMPLLGAVLASKQGELSSVDGSNATGTVFLTEVPQNLDTKISFKASGLIPDEQYVAIYYRNASCDLEPNSVEKSIQGAFFADANGEGFLEDQVKDSVNRIGSVSLRKAQDFKLVACGKV